MVARRRARTALGLAALLAAALPLTWSLDLSAQGLTNVTVVGDGASFAFYSDGSAVATADASDLATETTLYLQNNSLSSVPAELLSAMTAATVIDLSDNPLTKIETGSFDGLPLLEEIRCTDTKLRTISSKAVANCPKLEAVYLSGGNLTVLYSDSFYNLSKIDTLDLSVNTLPTVPNSLITLSKSWKALNFSNNALTTIPTGVQNIVAEGFVSFNWNLIVEIDAYAFAGAEISELYIASNAIFTVNSEAFSGMNTLTILDLSDNIISVIDTNAFEGLDNLEQLRLGRNNLHRLTATKFPRNLVSLELQENRLDLLPSFPDTFVAPNLRYLNLSNNILWSMETNSELQPYSGLVTLDLASNQLRNFTPTVFDPILSSIEVIHFDDNLISSIPRTTFVSLLQRLLTNVSLSNNPGVGWAYDNNTDAQCPNGSVFTQMGMGSSSSATAAVANLTLYGCIQCKAGTYHDNSTNSCQSCTSVSERAFADEDGATYCSYCPYSSDLNEDRTECHTFECNTYCWFTLSFGISVPGLIFGSKFLLMIIAKTTKRSRRVNFKEREDMNEWRMGLVMHQLGEISPHDALLDEVEADDDAHSTGAALRIYDFPEETKDMVLETLQEHFELRKQKMRVKMSAHELDEAMEWDDVEWQTFHMHRILSRNYHGEVFLGDYIGSQVVVKRMMTLRFEVRELADAISDIELMLTFRHPQIVQFLGTMWRDPEHLCVISEYVKGGDLGSLLEAEAMNARANTSAAVMNDLESSFDLSTSPSESFHVGGGGLGSMGEENQGERTIFNASYYSTTRLQMMLDVCLGLAYTHDLGFHHGDLRSRNVLVTEAFRCKLNDFQHHSRTTKLVGMTAQLTPAALATSTSVIEGDDIIIRSNTSDEDEEDDDVIMMEHANPEGVRFREPLIKREVPKDPGPILPLVAPEVVLAQRRARHWSADMYSVGVLLMEVWCQPFVSFETGSTSDVDKKRSVSAGSASGGDDNASQEEKIKSQRQQQQQQQRALDTAIKHHNEQLRRFMDTLRGAVLATVNDDASNNSRSFRTTTTTCSSLTSAASPCSPQAVAKVLGAIEECLSADIKKRPTAKALAKLFQNLLDDMQTR